MLKEKSERTTFFLNFNQNSFTQLTFNKILTNQHQKSNFENENNFQKFSEAMKLLLLPGSGQLPETLHSATVIPLFMLIMDH